MNREIREAVDILRGSRFVVALTGAGISVASGIPDFRSPAGLWRRFDPAVYASIDRFRENPARAWEMLFEMIAAVDAARPNPAHDALAELERRGLLQCCITQNIDGLHGRAGSRNVIEFHGNLDRFVCLACESRYGWRQYAFPAGEAPRCFACGSVLKPSIVFFGETVPGRALLEGRMFASSADAILVIGTGATVFPAAEIPQIAKNSHAKVIEVNTAPTGLTNYITDVFVQCDAAVALPAIAEGLGEE
ncbi:MAG: NAD-dependent protein deacylase [Spirochaetes bacterium]|nr:NAD-dependent protein deacylase [Spirochaetota bacterium]